MTLLQPNRGYFPLCRRTINPRMPPADFDLQSTQKRVFKSVLLFHPYDIFGVTTISLHCSVLHVSNQGRSASQSGFFSSRAFWVARRRLGPDAFKTSRVDPQEHHLRWTINNTNAGCTPIAGLAPIALAHDLSPRHTFLLLLRTGQYASKALLEPDPCGSSCDGPARELFLRNEVDDVTAHASSAFSVGVGCVAGVASKLEPKEPSVRLSESISRNTKHECPSFLLIPLFGQRS